jgi:diphthine-ammonia ligase
MLQVFTSWSGGKDCCLACYRASVNGLNVRYLANMVSEDGQRSWSHGLSAELLQLQSQAIGIPLVRRQTSRDNYEAEFKAMLRDFKEEGIDGGVFGDIDFNEHREWIERVCRYADIVPHLPLWEQQQDKLLKEFIDLGFEAVVVSAKADLFGEEILGRKLDSEFISDLDEMKKTKQITSCGEAGEYHTFVIGGPLFKRRVEILETNKVLREGRWFLDILKGEIRDKR